MVVVRALSGKRERIEDRGCGNHEMCTVLTVPESKRLIAKGIARNPDIERAMKKGVLALCQGTTNRYVAEELLGKRLDRPYCHGAVTPDQNEAPPVMDKQPDIVFMNGKPREMNVTKAIYLMKTGDVVLKGGNALNYRERRIGVLSISNEGGTIGQLLGQITAKRIKLYLPIGLEKTVPLDLNHAARELGNSQENRSKIPTMFVLHGWVFTEIQALRTLTGVETYPVASGGVMGCQGSVRLLIRGTEKQIEKTEEVLNDVKGEPPFSP